MLSRKLVLGVALASGIASAQNMSCNLQNYKPASGIKAEQSGNSLTISWAGESNEQLRAQFTIRDGQPVVQELAARDTKGTWIVLGKDLSPEFQVTTGRRRISGVQRNLLKVQGIDTPEQENIRKWNTFWDAPLVMPGHHDSTDLTRLPEEIKRAAVEYKSDKCTVTTTGERVSVTFNGLSLGVFAGDLQFTAYKGSNLLRQEAIAKTEEPSVAYIYKAGLKGFSINSDTKVGWRDTAHAWQECSFGGAPNKEPVNMRARNRLEILDVGAGSLAVLPPPHKFFFARENEVNLRYVYYRKDTGTSVALGVMQPERGEGNPPGAPPRRSGRGVSARRTNRSRTTVSTMLPPARCSAWRATTTSV